MGTTTGREAEVLQLLQSVGIPLDDDDIAGRTGINRHYVNRLCRTLADQGAIVRQRNAAGKLANTARAMAGLGANRAQAEATERPSGSPSARLRRHERARRNVDDLIAGFGDHVDRFERSEAFPGPSLYFHERAIERRRSHKTASSLLLDERFLEYIYAVLPAWGMHRMGKQRAKVGTFTAMVGTFRANEDAIEKLWWSDVTATGSADAPAVADALWSIIASLAVSTSRTRIVAGSKALHHVLPDLVPPIDRQYTFQFFTGQTDVPHGEQVAFLEWFPLFCEVGRRCRVEIDRTIERGGFMATSRSKVIDNAIIGWSRR